MKSFDLHADIGYDIMQKKRKGIETGILGTYHLDKFHTGEIAYICMASFFSGQDDWPYMQAMIESVRKEIDANELVDLVLRREDLINDNGHIKAIMSVEGMCGITDSPREKIRWMYEQGVRLASFCWNEENALATGVRGTPTRGLTAMGKEALDELCRHSMIVDVSHANETTFWDILNRKDAHVIASHSNVYSLCEHPRNLKDEQIEALLQRGTLIGMNSAPQFVNTKEHLQDIPHLVQHMEWLKTFAGTVDMLAFGFDFMDYYDDQEHFTKDLHDCTQTQLVVEEMRKVFTEEEVRKISYENARTYFANRL